MEQVLRQLGGTAVNAKAACQDQQVEEQHIGPGSCGSVHDEQGNLIG
jgi:hypothetical protein